jgi:hypothetical protein
MRQLGMSTFAVLVVAIAVAGCDIPPDQRSRDVCTVVCNCLETGTNARAECVEMCIPDIPTVSDDCLTCVYENSASCSTLFRDCEDMCDQSTPLLGGMQ